MKLRTLLALLTLAFLLTGLGLYLAEDSTESEAALGHEAASARTPSSSMNPGSSSVRASDGRTRPGPVNVGLDAPSPKPDDLEVPATGAVHFEFVDDEGRAISDEVELHIVPVGKSDGLAPEQLLTVMTWAHGVTDAQGRFEVDNLLAGREYRWRAESKGHMLEPDSGSFAMDAGETEAFTIVVGTGTIVRGALPLADGLANGTRASLRLYRNQETRHGTMWAEDIQGGISTDSSGRFEFDTEPGLALVCGSWVEPGNHLFISQVTVEIAPGVNDLGTLPLEDSSPVEVRQVFRVGGRELPREQLFQPLREGEPRKARSREWGMFSVEASSIERRFSMTAQIDPQAPIFLFGLYPEAKWRVRFPFNDHLAELRPEYTRVGSAPITLFEIPRTEPVDLVWHLSRSRAFAMRFARPGPKVRGRISLQSMELEEGEDWRRNDHLRLETLEVGEHSLPEGSYAYLLTPDAGREETESFFAQGVFELRDDDALVEITAEPGASLFGRMDTPGMLRIRFVLAFEGIPLEFEHLWRVDGDFVIPGLPPHTRIEVMDHDLPAETYARVKTGEAGSRVEVRF